jgi:hypothetical protein
MSRSFIALTLLFAMLAGCFQAEACEVFVPTLTGGTAAQFVGDGPAFTSTLGVISNGAGSHDLSKSPMWISASATTQQVLGKFGSFEDALQVTYWVDGADGPIATNDEWVSQADGAVVQATDRQSPKPAGQGHFTSMVMRESPAFIFATPMGGKTWSRGDRASHELPGFYGPDSDRRLEIQVVKVWRNEVCHMTVMLRVVGDGFASIEHEIEYGHGNPLPLRFATSNEIYGQVEIRQVAFRPGGGDSVGPYSVSDLDSNIRLVPMQDSLAQCCRFPTTFSGAVEAVKSDPAAGPWLQQRPNAQLMEFHHFMGAPGSGTVDAWQITWTDGASARQFDIYRQEILLPVQEKFIVDAQSVDVAPAFTGSIASFSDFWKLAERHLGAEPEVLLCEAGLCSLGTHESTNAPRAAANGGGAGVYTGSLRVQMATGYVVVDSGHGGIGLHPPAPFPG